MIGSHFHSCRHSCALSHKFMIKSFTRNNTSSIHERTTFSLWFSVGVTIFIRFDFYPKKKKIDWIKKNQTAGSNWSVSIILEQKPKSNRLVSVWFDSVSVRFGYFILKTKNYIVFWVFFVISKGFGFGLARFFINFSLVWFFGFRLMKSNRSVF
jgi:hypothetical protein